MIHAVRQCFAADCGAESGASGHILPLLLLSSSALCVAWQQVQYSYLAGYRDFVDGVRDLDGLIGVTHYGKYSKDAFGSNIIAPLTHKLGSEICSIGGFAYMGLQAGIGCYCGNSYGRHGVATGCSSACTGNSSQTCGGSGRNSVFRLTYKDDFKPPSRFTQASRSTIEPASVAAKLSEPPLYRAVSAQSRIVCASLCRAGCRAVLFNSRLRLCHLLRLYVLAGDLLSAEGDFLIRD